MPAAVAKHRPASIASTNSGDTRLRTLAQAPANQVKIDPAEPWRGLGPMLSDDLIELGQEAVDAVSSGIANGAPLVKCQLLASAFYEALRHELRRADETKRATLLAVTDQCHRGAVAHISPNRMLSELRSAIALLQVAP